MSPGLAEVAAMEECYSLAYEENHKQFMTEDVEFVQRNLSKNPRFHRIRVLISDPELIHADIKHNSVY